MVSDVELSGLVGMKESGEGRGVVDMTFCFAECLNDGRNENIKWA